MKLTKKLCRSMKVKEIWISRIYLDKFKDVLFLVIDNKGNIIFHNKNIKPYKHELFKIIDKLQDF